MLRSLNVVSLRCGENCTCCLQAKLNLLHCCMEWLTIACEVCVFVYNLMSTAAFNDNLSEKKGSFVKNETQYN